MAAEVIPRAENTKKFLRFMVASDPEELVVVAENKNRVYLIQLRNPIPALRLESLYRYSRQRFGLPVR